MSAAAFCIQTERLILRQMTGDDLDVLAPIFADPEMMRFYPQPFTRHRTQEWIDWSLRNYVQHGFGLWAVVLRQTGQVIGDCGITMQEVEAVREPELGYHIRRDLWRQGLAREAARASRDWAFSNVVDPPRGRLISIVHPDNAASAGVAQSVGMTLAFSGVRNGKSRNIYAIPFPLRP
jgi:RimJ/RimL family protein N-acetyltransferase